MDGVYAEKAAKVEKEMKELADNCNAIAERKRKVRNKVKEANGAIEAARNKVEVKKGKDDKEGGSRKRGGVKQKAEKQFKQPTGVLPDKIPRELHSSCLTNMRLYIRTCSNLDVLNTAEQRTLCIRFIDSALWSQVIFFNNDDISTVVKRVEEAFERLQPLFFRKVKSLDLMNKKGERFIE